MPIFFAAISRPSFPLCIRLRSASIQVLRFDCLVSRKRSLSTNRRRQESFRADGLPFTISPEESTEKFFKWAYEEQGLRFLLNKNKVRISASYCPVWSFDVNVRYVVTDSQGKEKLGWKPEIFRGAYGNQAVIFLPGMSAYAGYSYRRSLLNPLHNISLLFLGDQTVPFGDWMLRDMKLANGAKLGVIPDPWNTTKARAFAVVKDEMEALANESPYTTTIIETEVIRARRVYMPTYVFEYKVLGAKYFAFVSGCDTGATVSGDSHKVFEDSDTIARSSSYLNQAFGNAQTVARVLGPRGVATGIQLFLAFVGRVLVRIPLIASLATLFVGFRKVVHPFIRKRSSTAAWERQRNHEALMDEAVPIMNNFSDGGAARRFFEQNRRHIVEQLSRSQEHTRGAFDWYASWEAWAREQYQKQQEHEYHGYEQNKRWQQQEQQHRQTEPRKNDFRWDFDPDDPYDVLNIKRSASKAEISAAYRKHMLAHHPDLQAGRSEAEKQRAMERTKIINEAYRKLKNVK